MSEQKSPADMNEAEFQGWLEMAPTNTEASEDGLYLHVPIAYLEPDLRNTFQGNIEITIKKQTIIDGILTIIVRLKVFHPVKKIYLKYDGIAGTILQNISAGKFEGTTKITTVEYIKPEIAACYSEAIKNAAKKIGKRFGSDINRVNKPGAKPIKETVKKKAVDNRVLTLINDCESIEELNRLLPTLPSTPEVQDALNEKLTSLKKTIKTKK